MYMYYHGNRYFRNLRNTVYSIYTVFHGFEMFYNYAIDSEVLFNDKDVYDFKLKKKHP